MKTQMKYSAEEFASNPEVLAASEILSELLFLLPELRKQQKKKPKR